MKTETAIALTDDQQFATTEAEEIRRLLRRAAKDIVTIGQKLIAVKARLNHGEWGAWLRSEFDWDSRTAQRFMSVGDRFKNDNLSDLNIAPSALYLLAAPSTPEDVRREMLERARNGEKITVRTAEESIAAMQAVGEITKAVLEHSQQESAMWDQMPPHLKKLAAMLAMLPKEQAEALCRERSWQILAAYNTPGVPRLTIDPDFIRLFPAPQPGEYDGMTASIRRRGVIVPLKVWRGILLDGHVRYEICHLNGVPFDIEEVDLPDRQAAVEYIMSMHIRANYTEDQKAIAAVRLMEYAEKNGEELAALAWQ